ncbi:hypothetical protein J31TS4_41170 [Paenibacillus sp. J31TS4]|uniref:hypothetical protein n=1 Tax=Paenibacillus sp. J31TS4 TaxID=2807195 RepID=UPI001B17A98C|nr:hypothetical protein [Paenibacillus sp. J31TS4]GIP40837.1 hypothetical protein J31TS4_41170 [Paenibacillus sp. J31TS4]
MKEYHCCATCVYYEIRRGTAERFFCGRLGYATRPSYRFDCWTPKETVRRRLEAEAKLEAER